MKDSSRNISDKIQQAIILQLSAYGSTGLPFNILVKGVKLLGIQCPDSEIEKALDVLVKDQIVLELFEESDLISTRYQLKGQN